MKALCWRHETRLILVAFGSLLDLTGKIYPKAGMLVLGQARDCKRCQRKSAEVGQ